MKLIIKIVNELDYGFSDIKFVPQDIYYSSGIPEFGFDVAGGGLRANKLFKRCRFEKWLS
jgi:hypothetical protein